MSTKMQVFVALGLILLVLSSFFSPSTLLLAKAQGSVGVYEHGVRNSGQKLVALTFDLCQQTVGDNVWLDQTIVDVLAQTGTPATFFASGLFVQQHPEEVRMLATAGHEIEAHFWDHPNNGAYQFDQGTLDLNLQIGQTNDVIAEVTGKKPTYVRLPAGNGLNYDTNGIANGVVNEPYLRAINQAGTSVLDWDIVSGDPDVANAQIVINNVQNSVQPGSIVVMHGNGRGVHTAEALQVLIPWLQSQGYTLVTVEQMNNLTGLEPVLSGTETVEAVETQVVPEPMVAVESNLSPGPGGKINCDAYGKCVANLDYYYPAYTGNVEYGFEKLGQGSNSWTIAGGDVPVSFGAQIGSMSDTGYVPLVNALGQTLNAVGVCDVSAITHWYAVTQLGMTVTNPAQKIKDANGVLVGHTQVPILPDDYMYRDTIYQEGDTYTQDTIFKNPGESVTIYWSIDSDHNLTIWNSRNGGSGSNQLTTSAVEQTVCFLSPAPDAYANPSFGYNWDYAGYLGMTGLHEAQDFTNGGVPFEVVAVSSGTIVRHEPWNSGSGGVLEIELDPPFEAYKVQYVHLDSSNQIFANLAVGKHIESGQVLGEADGSGSLSSGVHLHFKVWKNGQTIDPVALIGTCTTVVTGGPAAVVQSEPNLKQRIISNPKNFIIVGALVILLIIIILLLRRRVNIDVASFEPEKKGLWNFIGKGAPYSLTLTIAGWLSLNPSLKKQFGLALGNEYLLDIAFGVVCVFWILIWYQSTSSSQYYAVRKGDQIEIYKKAAKPIRLWQVLLAILLGGLSYGWWFGLRLQLLQLMENTGSLTKVGEALSSILSELRSWGIDINPDYHSKIQSLIQSGDGVLITVIIIGLLILLINRWPKILLLLLAVVLVAGGYYWYITPVDATQPIVAVNPSNPDPIQILPELPALDKQPPVQPGELHLSCDFSAIEAGLGPVNVTCDENGYPRFAIRYWNGNSYNFYVEPSVLAASLAATDNQSLALLMLAVANSESSSYTSSVCSPVGACGTWQFMPGTWSDYAPSGYSDQSYRYNTDIQALGAAALLGDGANGYGGMRLYEKLEKQAFIDCFYGRTCACWNQHEPQADYVFRLWWALKVSAGIR